MNMSDNANVIDILGNKRQFERYDIKVPVRIEILSKRKRAEIYVLETHNLSAGGAFFKSTNFISKGTLVSLEIMLNFDELMTFTNPEGSVSITCTGRVFRSDPEGMVICFNDDFQIFSCDNPMMEKIGYMHGEDCQLPVCSQ